MSAVTGPHDEAITDPRIAFLTGVAMGLTLRGDLPVSDNEMDPEEMRRAVREIDDTVWAGIRDYLFKLANERGRL